MQLDRSTRTIEDISRRKHAQISDVFYVFCKFTGNYSTAGKVRAGCKMDQGQRDWGGECGHLPRGLAKADKFGVIMCHNDHWFSGVADSNHLKLFVSDSDKYFKKEDRETCVGEWCQWLQKLWNSKKQVVSVNRSSVEQQGAGSNDGGIHAIRNVLRELRCGEAPVYTRAVIKKAMKHKQTQEKEEDAWKAERDAKEAARKKPAPKKGGKRK